ncbi:MAG: HAD-IA family hydrolase [Janthinobacterium lividum]
MHKISSIGDLSNYIGRHVCISFDLFDTLICRRYLKVNEVHDTVSAFALAQIGRFRTGNPFDLTLLRYKMSDVLKTSGRGVNQEPVIDVVWDHILRRDVPDAIERAATVERIVAFEIELELANLAPVAGAIELLARLKDEGHTLIAVSDMYFDMRRMRVILEKLGLLGFFDRLYVSAEIGLTKQTGDLFRHVLDDLGLAPAQILHAGDNMRSDVERATKLGFATVFVDQPQLLEIRRPAYGARPRIEAEIADLVKMHLFALLLDAQDRKLDRIFFLARDGCAISAFLTCWRSSLVERFLPPPAYDDLYLNRILSCWGGIDFAGRWLRQAIDLVLWLHHDAATPDELCTMLGLETTPAALGNAVLRPGDADRVEVLFADSKHQDAIKNTIIARRAELVAYLDGIGFFANRSVAFSDVGYTGTVLRDLNNLFLNRAVEESVVHPPAMLLSLLATNDNLVANKSRAYPFVDFSPQAILPAAKLPQDLKASFAWLEFFFKHPTLLPILRFTHVDGRIEPELRHQPPEPDPVPSERVLRHAVAEDEDIVLLWMAALDFTGQIVDPILARFDHPDADTIAQMQDEIFEKHSVQGTRRSIFLTMPGARIETIIVAAQKGDYWLPGSVAASGFATHATPAAPFEPRPRRRRLRDWFRTSKPDVAAPRATVPRGRFDPAFYRDFYGDLRQFTTDYALWDHYDRHGRAEKRLPTHAALVAQLEAEFHDVPADFDGRGYLRLNGDLGGQIDTPVQALDHYMRHGRHEGRRYLRYDADLLQAFERLRAAGRIVLTDDEATSWSRGEDTLTLYLRRHGIRLGAWLDDLDPAEFRVLHRDWCGRVGSAAECIVVLLEHGLARAPSLSLRAPFDPDYYRNQMPELADLGLEALYRHYLDHASRAGLYPSEQAALRALWGQAEYPAAFDWQGYGSTKPDLVHADRLAVLAAFLDDPDVARALFVGGDGAAALLDHLAVRAWRHHGRTEEARTLFHAALDAGAGVGRIHHQLGDLALQLGQSDQALGHFRTGAAAPDADLWSSFHAARLLLERGDYCSALVVLEASAAAWQERAPWRRLWDAGMRAKCTAILHKVSADSFGFDEADAVMAELAARQPADTPLAGGEGVVVVTSRQAIDHAGLGLAGITVIDPAQDDLVAALLARRTVIVHDARFSHDTLRTIALARGLGRRTIAWLGDLVAWEEYRLDRCLADDAGSAAVRLDAAMDVALAARYADAIVTTLPGYAPALGRFAPHVVPDIVGIAHGNRRGAAPGQRVLLVSARLDWPAWEAVAQAIAVAPDDAFFLVPGALAQQPALRAIAGRWSAVDDDPALPDLARLVGTVDGVLQIGSDASYSVYSVVAEAVARGIAAASVEVETADIAMAIRRLLQAPAQAGPSAPVVQPLPTGPPFRSKPRILFVNVFFAPQVIGGATRVLTDNIDYLLDHYRDAFDLAVFTGDEQNDRVDEWRIDAYRGIPVYRVATPQELNMDWRAANDRVGARFQAVLDAFKPDLVHIHCLQRLSVTVAEVCRASDIRYLVTLHDAWWISDFPFLTDAAGMPAAAEHDYYAQPRLGGVGVERSVARAERLRAALLGAERRLSVSESFADIYRACGIPCDTIENGVSRISSVTRAASGPRVNLCHIGGLQHHKGAYLIEATLRANTYDNLHLTIVDLARGPNQVTRATWGATPVTITGKMSTTELAQFYAGMNVLLAPSTWPESYGLVSREALAHGLWVIASREGGAMSDPVIAGRNGFVVSIDNNDDLAAALRMIDRDAATYSRPPAEPVSIRTADDQSRDLVDLYKALTDALKGSPPSRISRDGAGSDRMVS